MLRAGHGIQKSMRILKRSDFLVVQSSGRKYHGRYLLLMVRATSLEAGRIGFTITKKIGNAVIRNRVRRLLREWFRTHGWCRAGLDVVVVAKPTLVVDGSVTDTAAIIRDLEKLAVQI